MVLISQVRLWMLDLQLENSRKAKKLWPCLEQRYRILLYLRFGSTKYFIYCGMDYARNISVGTVMFAH